MATYTTGVCQKSGSKVKTRLVTNNNTPPSCSPPPLQVDKMFETMVTLDFDGRRWHNQGPPGEETRVAGSERVGVTTSDPKVMIKMSGLVARLTALS
jgi:hypothetical protein